MKYGSPQNSWTVFGAPTHAKRRSRLRLSAPDPADPIRIEANALREIGNSAELRPHVVREVMPANTMAPCIVIGERAAHFTKAERRL
ncbi:hypothetical protein A5724_01570 [Mycobacterium sp. ACS1612]|uniref:hypothetical protein n=1 Tax=Mycobacterium sp. ACS1612 TaxID=1834117 RepID=UPI000801EC79|nr:hypothetical protein [Mycobacterium sp. ACS1612]OBF33847.1 hypothetical protein A5724_01570 [Mycobacterium sp. ACS1612]